MSLVNMQLSAEEAKEGISPDPMEAPRYPYGLTLCLDDDQIAKLGFPALPQVGSKMTLTARVEVTRVSQNETQGSEKEQSIGLQITDMELGPDQIPRDNVKAFYGA